MEWQCRADLKKLELQNKTGIPFKYIYSFCKLYDRNIEEKRNMKKFGNKTSKGNEKNICINAQNKNLGALLSHH